MHVGANWTCFPARCGTQGALDQFVFVTMLVRRERKRNSKRGKALWRVAAPQLSTVYCRSDGFADWHLDAVYSATLARLQAHQFGGAAGSFWIREPDRDFAACVVWRIYRRPLQPTPWCDLDADDFDDPCVHAVGADVHAFAESVALDINRVFGGHRKRLRRADTAGVLGADGGEGRPAECDRVEFSDV